MQILVCLGGNTRQTSYVTTCNHTKRSVPINRVSTTRTWWQDSPSHIPKGDKT